MRTLPPENSDHARIKALDVLSMMRVNGLSLTRASDLADTSRKSVLNEVGHVLTKRGSRWVAKPWDRISRQIRFLTERGLVEVEVRDSRTASRVARYWNAVDRYLKTGDESDLREFRGRTFSSRGVRHAFLTDSTSLERLALVGQVEFEDMYATAA